MFVDTHLHVADASSIRTVKRSWRASAAGVTTLIEIAESPRNVGRRHRIGRKIFLYLRQPGHTSSSCARSGTGPMAGLSKKLRDLLRRPKVAAIGEFGLDYFRMQNTKEQQEYIFRQQLDLAKEFDKPIVIHCRNNQPSSPAGNDGRDPHTLTFRNCWRSFIPDVVRTHRGCSLGRHSLFFGNLGRRPDVFISWVHARRGRTGEHPNSKELQNNVVRLPLERIVLETDSPYLPPQTHRGQRNEPMHIPAIAGMIASLKFKTARSGPANHAERPGAFSHPLTMDWRRHPLRIILPLTLILFLSGGSLYYWRSTSVRLTADGKTRRIFTDAKDIRGFLKEQHILLGPSDFTTPPLETPIGHKTAVKITRVTVEISKEISVGKRVINWQTRTRQNLRRVLVQRGNAAVLTKKIQVTKYDGIEISRSGMAEKKSRQPSMN